MIELLQTFTDPLEVEEHYRTRQVEIQVIPSTKGAFLYKKKTAAAAGMFMRMSEMSTSWAMQNRNDSDVFFISLPGTGDASWEVEGKWETPLSVSIVDNRLVTQAKYAEGTRLDTIVLPSQALHADLAALIGRPCHKRIKFDSETALRDGDVQALRHIAAAMKIWFERPSLIEESPIAMSYLKQAMSTIILQGASHNYRALLKSIPSDVTPGRIKRAIDFIYANAHRPLRLDEIAESAALSVRGLQAGFVRYREISPMSFLRNVRLEYVRADLLNPDVKGSCEEIVTRWGFTNFHRFARAYLAAFGEPPRQTFQKAR